jgi:hypothetical protein
MRTLRDAIQIVLLGVGIAIAYGIMHDQVTVRLSPEYFTRGHPDIFPTRAPTLLALGWGVIASWWAGIALAVPLAISAQVGAHPRVHAGQLLRPMLFVMFALGGVAALAAAIGFALATAGGIALTGPIARQIPDAGHVMFLTAGWSHGASYAGGAVGAITLWVYAWNLRRQPGATQSAVPLVQHHRTWWEPAVLNLLTLIGGLGLVLVALYLWLLAMLVYAGL